ncbi:MAG: hypothetical protein L0287_22215, partial [Anaerolineae bacterium]|nr:hypothetical protein [Anaerolineae bacterium]
MELCHIVYQGKTKKGRDIVIRYPVTGDAKGMQEYINTMSMERTFIRFQGEQVSLEDEQKYLQSQLEKIDNGRTVQLVVVHRDRI